MPASKFKQQIEARFPWLIGFVRSSLTRPFIDRRYVHAPKTLRVETGETRGSSANDTDLIARLVASYLDRASETPTSQWSDIFLDHHADIHAAVVTGDLKKVEQMLRNPVSCDMFYGFDSLSKSLRKSRRIDDVHAPALTLDALVSLAEAMGVRGMHSPERLRRNPIRVQTDDVIPLIEKRLGHAIELPNFYPSERGLKTANGIMSYRVPQAIYQAWRLKELAHGKNQPRILEIGGGLGRTAFYAAKLGIEDYTIVDIPVSSMAQGYFLGRALGESKISLQGEPAGHGVKLISPEAFLLASDKYDIIFNADSLTEIGHSTAMDYWQCIRARCTLFLSVNQEANEFTVGDLVRSSGDHTYYMRVPYWLRPGYVEEIVRFNAAKSPSAI